MPAARAKDGGWSPGYFLRLRPAPPDWCLQPAVVQANAVRSGAVSSAQLVEQHIEQIERYDRAVNAVVVRMFAEARQRAREADEALAQGQLRGPLHGVPITVKESYMVTGTATTCAVPALKGYVAGSNALNVQRLIDAGAIVLGKTNLPVAAADMQSFNSTYGRTNNPWDLSKTCGGSSGGSAAALACGFGALELGSDIGGSIRIPAHFNGVCGHKPSYGIGHLHGHVPGANHRALQPYSELRAPNRARTDPSFGHGLAVGGPLARCCADLEVAMRLLARPEPVMEQGGWSFTLPPPRVTDVRALRVAAWLDDRRFPTDRDYLGLLSDAAAALERAGARVDREARPFTDAELEKHLVTYMGLLMSSGPEFGGGMKEWTHAEWQKLSVKRNFIKEAWEAFFKRYDVVLCPVLPVPAFPHTKLNPVLRKFDGKGIPRFGQNGMFLWPGIVIVADLPSTVVPIGRTPQGLPCGMQIVAPNFCDLTCIEVGKMLEAVHGPSRYVPPPLERLAQGQAKL
eukprot:TRINITY_DN65010_c0_g1_i1.p1 TRINITY_DN65010_c0_g1~~TRINITY_DN65010_c0_g1_i1.p1  ORF type:complete len:543 (+),score=158.65 TRINITY_DN65010_c0_g1_i1:88-1629(+)